MEKEIYKKQEMVPFHMLRWEELPNIELYVDQVICLIDNTLEKYISKEKKGHILTKTMINNYVKNDIIKPSTNKRYNKEHMANLFMICILKQVYSMNEIARLLQLLIKTDAMPKAYNCFCEELEKAIRLVFETKQSEKEEISFQEYALKSIVLSFAHKLYIEKRYLKGETSI